MIHAKKKDGSIEKVARSSIKYIGGQEKNFKGEGDGQDLKNMKMYIVFFFSKYSTKLILILRTIASLIFLCCRNPGPPQPLPVNLCLSSGFHLELYLHKLFCQVMP